MGFGVDVVVIQPGLIRTEFAATAQRGQGGGEGDHRATPPIRVRVTPSAHVLVGLNGLMSDGMWDRFLAGQFPRAGA